LLKILCKNPEKTTNVAFPGCWRANQLLMRNLHSNKNVSEKQ